MKLIATKGQIENNNLEVIVKKSNKYFQGFFDNNKCKMNIQPTPIYFEMVDILVNEFGFKYIN